MDVNDNAPVFDQFPYKADIAQDFPVGGLVVTVNAVDKDAGDNGHVYYALANPSAYFQVRLLLVNFYVSPLFVNCVTISSFCKYIYSCDRLTTVIQLPLQIKYKSKYIWVKICCLSHSIPLTLFQWPFIRFFKIKSILLFAAMPIWSKYFVYFIKNINL